MEPKKIAPVEWAGQRIIRENCRCTRKRNLLFVVAGEYAGSGRLPTFDCRGFTEGPDEGLCDKWEGYSAGECCPLYRLAFLQINTMMSGIAVL